MQILYEHPWFLVINKPSDLLTQAVEGIATVQTELEDLLRARIPTGPNPFIGIPHRLDRVTTGVMVVARNQRALRRISEQFASRKVSKTYHALIESTQQATFSHGLEYLETGHSNTDAAQAVRRTLSDFLRKIPNEPRGEICDPSIEGARNAVLHYRLLQSYRTDRTDHPVHHVEVELDTGRMHQIRLQFASRGAPILGDSLYGSKMVWEQGEFRQAPIALHAHSLTFFHPQSAERLSFVAEPPPAWSEFFASAQQIGIANT